MYYSLACFSQDKEYELVVSDLNNPWGFTFLPDNSMLITEKEGKLIHFKNGVKTDINGVPEIYRLNDDGSIPKDNPFINNKNAKKAIYSYDHRNPQGMKMNPFTKQIWAHEHGPKGGDEINIIQKGKNYGWPKVSYGINYSGTKFTEKTSLPNMENPIHYWTPSIAPSGMASINSDTYGKWKGNLLVGSLKFKYISRCILKGSKVFKEVKLLKDIGRVRSIEQGIDGYIYVGVENLGIVKLLPIE